MLFGRRGSRSRGQRRGAALVEFAMVVPVVFLFMFGLIELSRMVMVQQSLTNAAQRGCREAMLATTLSEQDVRSAVRGYLGGCLGSIADTDSVRISVSPQSLAVVEAGTDITVQVEVDAADVSWLKADFRWFGGTLAAKPKQNFALTGRSTLVRE
jgi:Flp pilus assembly protein TadG